MLYLMAFIHNDLCLNLACQLMSLMLGIYIFECSKNITLFTNLVCKIFCVLEPAYMAMAQTFKIMFKEK